MESILKEILMDHVKSPKFRLEIENPTISVNSNNPVCGDVVKVDLKVDNEIITEVGTSGNGCAVSQASMSILGEEIINSSVSEANIKILEFKSLFEQKENFEIAKLSEQAQYLQFLSSNPSKVRCAMLSWTAVQEALLEF